MTSTISAVQVNGILRIYIGESHYGHGMPLYEDILYRARQYELAGATVFKTVIGFGHAELRGQSARFSGRVSDDIPMVIEIVDDCDKLRVFAQEIRPLLGRRGLMTLQLVDILHYGDKSA